MKRTCKKLKWVGHVVRIWETRNAYTVLVRKPVGKRSIKVDLKGVSCERTGQ